MNRREFIKVAGATFAATLAWPSAEALARAGGGTSSSGTSSTGGGYRSSGFSRSSTSYGSRSSSSSSHHRGGGTGTTAPWWVFLLFAGAAGAMVLSTLNSLKKSPATAPRRRSYDAADSEALLQRLARKDDAWSPEHMQARVEEVYHHVQQAWTERNQDIARNFMSPRLYARHKRMTDEMLAQGRRNVLEDIRLLDCDIVHVADRKGTHDDEFWAVITGSMIDYEVRDGRGPKASLLDDPATARMITVMQQLRTPPKRFQELWKFTRDDHHGWVLDKIEQDLDAGIAQARIFSHEAS